MIAKLVVEGKEFDIEILDPKLQELIAPKKKIGYERLEQGQTFFYQHSDGNMEHGYDHHNGNINNYFNSANYYSSEAVAENNVRADKLMRQLRRFAVEHRVNELDWTYQVQRKYYIYYGNRTKELLVGENGTARDFGVIYFDSEKTANLAIEIFRDELIWYFTEYKDSL